MSDANDGSSEVKKTNSIYKTIRFYVLMFGLLAFIKFFIIDIYAIPSGSMEQTLHGRPSSGDRILCTKFSYWFKNPSRWDVFVFKFPYMQTFQKERSPYKGENFIKRCVGLPGESMALSRGDVFIADEKHKHARRIVKPDSLQRKIWLPVYDETFSDLSLEELGQYWTVNGITIDKGQLVTSQDKATLSFKPQCRFGSLPGIPDRYVRRQYVNMACPVSGCGGHYRRTITNPKIVARCPRCGYYLTEKDVTYYDYRCGYPNKYRVALETLSTLNDPALRNDDWHIVPDLRFRVRVSLPNADSVFEVQIFDDLHLGALRVTPGNSGVIFALDGKNQEISSPVHITKGEHNVEFYRLDGVFRIFIDGVAAGEFAVDDGFYSTQPQPTVSNIDVLCSKGIKVSRLTIDRDIYYYHQDYAANFPDGFYDIPFDCYMAMGDNCPSSNDSRDWGTVPQVNLVGKAQLVWWPLDALRLIW